MEVNALWGQALDGPDTGQLAGEIVALALSWADGDPERLAEAARILATTPYLEGDNHVEGPAMRWHRIWYRRDDDPPSVKSLMYVPDDAEYAAWSIDRIGQGNGSRTYLYEYQAVYRGERIGTRFARLSEAKHYVESR